MLLPMPTLAIRYEFKSIDCIERREETELFFFNDLQASYPYAGYGYNPVY